jgi:hypothetical protein
MGLIQAWNLAGHRLHLWLLYQLLLHFWCIPLLHRWRELLLRRHLWHLIHGLHLLLARIDVHDWIEVNAPTTTTAAAFPATGDHPTWHPVTLHPCDHKDKATEAHHQTHAQQAPKEVGPVESAWASPTKPVRAGANRIDEGN